jgi:hypothetical protein
MRTTIIILILLAISFFNLLAQQPVKPIITKYSGRVVVFFQVNQVEYDSLARDTASGIDDLVDDFQYYANKVQSFLKGHDIKSQLTSADIVEINWLKNNFIFDRHKGEQVVGMILSDSLQEPKIFYGVSTDDGLINKFVKYFKIK